MIDDDICIELSQPDCWSMSTAGVQIQRVDRWVERKRE